MVHRIPGDAGDGDALVFFNFRGESAADDSRSISSTTATGSAKFGAIRVEINGVHKWIRIYEATAVGADADGGRHGLQGREERSRLIRHDALL